MKREVIILFTIDMTAFGPLLMQLGLFIVSLFGSYLAHVLRAKYKNDQAASVLETVIEAGCGFARGKLMAAAGTNDLLRFNTHSAAVAHVANFVLTNAPSAVKAMGLTEQGIEQWALAALTKHDPDLVYIPGVQIPSAPTLNKDMAPTLGMPLNSQQGTTS